ncbi:hypothetical protein H920_00425 [Fukomys damarensis]|uniref:Uncharacterized protein n=1 Tax=Fukomys damarensis TaxID=885580 RepID=A0A091E4F1_FUKDA|nr:hypothetical protein H920_00425 [Fukomys damarensis]
MSTSGTAPPRQTTQSLEITARRPKEGCSRHMKTTKELTGEENRIQRYRRNGVLLQIGEHGIQRIRCACALPGSGKTTLLLTEKQRPDLDPESLV